MFTQFVNYIQKNIGTSAVTLVTVPATTQLAINQLSCANVTNLSVTCSVTVTRAGVTIFILRDATVPSGGSLICVGESQKIVLMAGDVLQVQSSTATSIDCVVSGVLNDFGGAVAVPAPPTSPVATFSITPSTTSTIEGGTVTYNITTTNVPNGTVLYWQNFGTTSATDFTDDRNDGEVVITSNAGSFTRTLRTTGLGGDLSSEPSETIQIALQFRPGYLGGGVVAGATTVSVLPDSVITSGLQLYYDAGIVSSYPGSGTTWFDLSGNGRNGTLVSGVGYSSANGGSLVFDGVNDAVTTPYSAGSVTNLTVSVWWRLNTWQNDGAGIHFSVAPAQLYMGRGTSGGNSIDWRFYTGTFLQETEVFYTDTGWNHIVGTYDQDSGQGRMRLYRNGVLIATGLSNNTTAINVSANTVSIGGGAGAGFFDGNIAQVLIYNRTLTAAEVSQNFSSARGRYGI
jgi:hypothetical protein